MLLFCALKGTLPPWLRMDHADDLQKKRQIFRADIDINTIIMLGDGRLELAPVVSNLRAVLAEVPVNAPRFIKVLRSASAALQCDADPGPASS